MTEQPGSLVRLVERNEAPADVQAIYDSGQAQYGKLQALRLELDMDPPPPAIDALL